MSELNFKMGTKTSTVPSSGTSGEVFFTTDENKYGHIYFIDRKNKIINVIPNLLDIAHGGTGATTAAAALTNLGLTATATELNYVKGATSSLQTQLNNKSEKNHTHDYLSLNGGAITGKMDLTSFPNINDNYKMGKTSGASGGIHFKKKDGQNDYGNAITWSYSNNDESHAGIYVKSSGSYGTKMYLATTSSFSAGAMAALEIDHAGNISALRGNFKGDLTGNASTATKASSLKYHSTLQTDEAIDGFLEANTLKSTIWGSTSSVGTGNGIIISGGYASTNYGFQLAIDDDPTYFMALRQKGTNGWNEWKRIPMADGTGASGTWGIGITGNASSATKATQDASGNVITSTYATKSELNTAKSTLQTSIDGKAPSSHTHTAVNGVTPEWDGTIDSASYLAAWNSDGTKIKALSRLNAVVGALCNHKGTNLSTAEEIDNFITGNTMKYSTFKLTEDNGLGFASNDGMLLSIPWGSADYGVQIAFDDSSNNPKVAIRGKSSNWGSWKTIPFSDGANATGTWGIGITGNASTATKATQDASGNVITSTYATKTELNTAKSTLQSSIDSKAPSSHTHNYAGSSSAGGAANAVAGGVGQSNVYRHVWFSDNNTETVRNYDDDFKYNPSTNTLSVANLSGNASTATKATQDGNGNTITSTYATKTELNTTKSNLQSSIDGKLSLSGGTMTGSIIMPKNDNMGIIPDTNNYGQIGSSDKQFYRMYAKNFYGSLQGNATSATSATTATKATQDASGNVITSTYATKSELNTAKSALQASIDGKLPLSGGTLTGALTVNNTLKAYSIITDPYHVGIGSGGTGWYRIYTNTFNNASGKATCSFTIGRNYNSPMNEEYSFVVSVGYNGQMNITQLTGCVGGHIITKIRVVYKNSSTFYIDFYTTPNEYKNEYYICGSGTGTFQTPALVSSIGDGYSTYEFETVNGCKSDKGFTGDLTGNASTATTATNIKDYNGDYKIQIGYSGGGISGDQIAYIAGYTNSNGIKIKDVSKSALQSWLGLGSAAYTASTAYATSGHTHNYAGSSSAGGSATSAVKLDTATAGSATQPAYFSGGKPVACTYTLGKSVPSNAVFTDTTYSAATQSAQGLMSAADKKKLDGIASGANAYSLPTASSSTLGGVKTTSTVTSTSGLTACPIISGVPYYKDTNTTYSLSSFGITATAAELNYTDGVTSNIQTQLNGKVDLSSTQTVSGVKTFSNGIKIGNTTMSYDSTNKRLVISVT